MTIRIGELPCHYVDLDERLEVAGVRKCDGLAQEHARLQREGALDHSLRAEELHLLWRVWRSETTPNDNSDEVRRFFEAAAAISIPG